MKLNRLKPRQALNKAFLKVKPNRAEIERFKTHLIQLLDRTNDTESEEFHKNLVIDFLKKTYYDPAHFINTKGRNDLVIHNGDKASSSVGVVVEAKKPTNRGEMVTTEKLNTKAFQELVLYYLRERITHKNLEVKHLVITNINEWFIFDATTFDRLFAQSKNLVQQFTDFEGGRLSDTKTDFFYKHIAEPFIGEIAAEVEYTYFNLQDYQKPLRNADKADDTLLIALYKLLSPEHLLKLPFANDSNSLDKRFYSELLHIIGLTETKEGGKKLIGRNKEGERNTGSLLEDAIIQLDSLDKVGRMERPSQYGATYQERLFNVALELCITWINRILFLKLLEAQLITYHKFDKLTASKFDKPTAGKGDRSYAFLNLDKIKNYDDLNRLFFQVLARKYEERNPDVKHVFEKVPYLNSSLFEPTELEHSTLMISNLADDKTIPIIATTVLKNEQGKKRTGNLSTLEYLFEFLNAYDFSSEGPEAIQEDNKSLINASVLGLIFEKINGYKDGSFFTPGFITMYMCRETIRRAVLQKFAEAKGWQCDTLDALYDKIEDRSEANAIVNSIRICDPAVGSGHFLVSALNEMIAVKNDLKILQDRDGRRLKEYHVEVVNDELIVTDEEGKPFAYNPNNKESQRIQETLFHEKQTLIENCLFGVDINPNSVKICRLRLWIELLKSAYYVGFGSAQPPRPLGAPVQPAHALAPSQAALETLPNIDINIKCGNSLVSRFAIDADLKQALKKSKWNIESYRMAVATYRNAENKEQKRAMERLIADIKTDFRSNIADPFKGKLSKARGTVDKIATEINTRQQWGEKTSKALIKDLEKATARLKKLEAERDNIAANKIFENAFEWRFEFPEVLNEEGAFVGFDVVIGNPPYIRQEELADTKPYLQSHFSTYAGTSDLYVYFVELGINLLRQGGHFAYIIPNKWMRAGYGAALRTFVKNYQLTEIVDYGDLPVFEEATTYPCIVQLRKAAPGEEFIAANMSTLDYPNGMDAYLLESRYPVLLSGLRDEGWSLVSKDVQALLDKIRSKGVPLKEYVGGKIYRGVLTGLNEAFVIDAETRARLIAEDPNSAEVIKPFLAGRDIKRYRQPEADKYLLFTRRGIEIERYPVILRHLEQFKERLEPRPKDFTGKNWPGRKPGTYKWYEIQDAVDYWEEFENGKILYPDIAKDMTFTWDNHSCYAANTVYMIISDQKWLIAYLNSRLAQFFYRSVSNSIRGGYMRFFSDVLQMLPVPTGELPYLKGAAADALEHYERSEIGTRGTYEFAINRAVYDAFDLTQDEVDLLQEFEEGHLEYEVLQAG